MNYLLVHLIQNGNELMRNFENLSLYTYIYFIFSGANLTHVVVLKPKESGISNSSHAIVTYQKSEKNTDVQVRKKNV